MLNGKVSRKKLGMIVFSDTGKLKRLNFIVHPQLKLKVKEKAKGNCVIDAALLVQLGLNRLCDKIILVKSGKTAQIERLLNKGYSKEQILNVISEQEKQLKNLRPDLVVTNKATVKEVKDKVKKWLKKQQSS
jgi:dephospho-CoA kinase